MAKSCLTCKHWGKPDGARAMPDRMWQCKFPEDQIKLVGPAWVELNVSESNRWMTRTGGQNCDTWEKKPDGKAKEKAPA